jgi:hypothetical protein
MLNTLRVIWAVVLLLAARRPDLQAAYARRDAGGMEAQRRAPFAGAALYRHINGGAELYHQYGFDRLAVQDYSDGAAMSG